jgi:phosphate acyltransferase
MKPARVAVDAMGGDFGPSVLVEGSLAARRDLGIEIHLVGPAEAIEGELRRLGGDRLGLRVIDSPETIGMGERVTGATLKKRSSIQVAMELVRDGVADAFFSAGNTAACWTIARLVLGALENVERPALAAVVPSLTSRTLLIDVGANAHCKARNLEEFAIMGTVYTRAMFGTARPRVGLMSMGEEASKGTDVTKEVHEALKGSALNFVGNVEGHDIFTGKVDVVVMDGFTGNVVLKASETLAEAIFSHLRAELCRTPLRRFGAWLARGAFAAIRRRVDAAEHGGAPLLGIKGCCYIGHGRSTVLAVRQGIKAAAEFFASGVNQSLDTELRGLALRREAVEAGTA